MTESPEMRDLRRATAALALKLPASVHEDYSRRLNAALSSERAGAPTHGALNREKARQDVTVFLDAWGCEQPLHAADRVLDIVEACVVPDPRITRIETLLEQAVAVSINPKYSRMVPADALRAALNGDE